MKNSKVKIYLAATLYSLIMGLSFLFVKTALSTTDPLNALAHRFTISFISLNLAVFMGRIKLDLKLREIVSIIPLSLFYPTMFFGFQAFGLLSMSSSEAGIIQAVNPVITMLLATVFLKEKTTNLQKIALLLSVSGITFIFISKGVSGIEVSTKGALLMIISVFSAACYNVIARSKSKKYRVIDLTYAMLLVGFLIFNILSVGERIYNGNISSYFSSLGDRSFLISILYLGVLSSVVTSFLATYVLSKIDASKMSVFNNLGTLVSIFAGVFILKEELYFYHIVGAFMIILGVLGTNISLKGRRL